MSLRKYLAGRGYLVEEAESAVNEEEFIPSEAGKTRDPPSDGGGSPVLPIYGER